MDQRGAESVDDDSEDFAKFEQELGVKKQALSNDMIKHNDQMLRKDQEISIKRSQSNNQIKK